MNSDYMSPIRVRNSLVWTKPDDKSDEGMRGVEERGRRDDIWTRVILPDRPSGSSGLERRSRVHRQLSDPGAEIFKYLNRATSNLQQLTNPTGHTVPGGQTLPGGQTIPGGQAIPGGQNNEGHNLHKGSTFLRGQYSTLEEIYKNGGGSNRESDRGSRGFSDGEEEPETGRRLKPNLKRSQSLGVAETADPVETRVNR